MLKSKFSEIENTAAGIFQKCFKCLKIENTAAGIFQKCFNVLKLQHNINIIFYNFAHILGFNSGDHDTTRFSGFQGLPFCRIRLSEFAVQTLGE